MNRENRRLSGPWKSADPVLSRPSCAQRCGQQLGLLASVGHVERLDPVDPKRAEAVDHGEHLLGVLHVPEGVRPDRHAAGRMDRLDCLGDGGRERSANAGRPSIK